MSLITISVVAQGSGDGDIFSYTVASSLSLADLKGFIQADTNIAPESQRLFHNNSPLQGDQKTLEETGLKDGDMIAVLASQPQQQTQGRQPASNAAARQSQNSQQASEEAGRRREVESTRLQIMGNPQAMSQIREQRPALAEAINDSERFYQIWMEMMREQMELQRERDQQLEELDRDPFNMEAQKRIEEIIRQQAVQENLQHAYEHNPEVFARVTMLYVPVEVNNHPVKAFVDSGAQTTIMSPSCAESCGIMRLIDKRYSGVAKGVGTAQILGRVHSAAIRIGNSTMPCSFTVMEGKDVDLLLGLDMLKRFQALIDLRRNKLVFGDNNEVDFLGEADIPKNLEEAMQSEPTISGPNGTEIGAESGTVRPAGSSAAAGTASSSSQTSGAASQAPVSASAGNKAFQGQGRALGTGSAPAAQAAPTTNGTVAPQAGGHSEEKIGQLTAMGFSREEVISALDATGGNVELAAGLFFQ